jgi:hypothetical protein
MPGQRLGDLRAGPIRSARIGARESRRERKQRGVAAFAAAIVP